MPVPILMRLERYEQYSMKLKKKYAQPDGWYLETHNTVNVDIYRKFGFELMETGNVPGINIKHYAMLKK